MSGGSDGLYIMGRIDGLSCNMTIDTGANVTIIRKDLAQKLGGSLLWTPTSVNLQTVSGDKMDVFGRKDINITFGSTTYKHTAYVADITDPCLLGLDFLRKYNFYLNFKNNELHSESEDVALFEIKNNEIKSAHQVIAQNDFTLPARTELLLPGVITENQSFRFGITEYPEDCNNQKGVLVASTLVDLTNTIIPVRVANVSDKTRVIKKGEVFATCTPITCINKVSAPPVATSSESLTSELLQNVQLSEKERNAVEELIQEFKDVFSRTTSDVGRTSLAHHKIDTGDHPPIRQYPRRLPFAKREEVGKLLKEMQDSDVIEPSSSPWASPIVLVRKKDGSTRFCVDY
ncbi:retroviral aspartyl protease family protein, partial [Lasius niger]